MGSLPGASLGLRTADEVSLQRAEDVGWARQSLGMGADVEDRLGESTQCECNLHVVWIAGYLASAGGYTTIADGRGYMLC